MAGLVNGYIASINGARVRFMVHHSAVVLCRRRPTTRRTKLKLNRISGRVAEYIVVIDVSRVRFPADA